MDEPDLFGLWGVSVLAYKMGLGMSPSRGLGRGLDEAGSGGAQAQLRVALVSSHLV